MINRTIGSAITAAAILCLGTAPAQAYLDPGSGSVLIQVILGGLAGLAVGAKLFWQHIVYYLSFGRRGRKGDDE